MIFYGCNLNSGQVTYSYSVTNNLICSIVEFIQNCFDESFEQKDINQTFQDLIELKHNTFSFFEIYFHDFFKLYKKYEWGN